MKTGELSPSEGLLVIVNFNQKQEIVKFLEKVPLHFNLKHCLVVDDGSNDGSREIAENMGFRVVAHPKNIGVGAAIRTGIRFAQAAGYRWIIISAANGKMLPEEFSSVYAPITNDLADYVQGNRFLNPKAEVDVPTFRRLMIPLFSIFASILIGRRFSDITCGLRAYSLKCVSDPSIDLDQTWLNQYELEYYLHYKVARAKRYRILEVPVTMRYADLAPKRRSKIQPIIGWWSMIRPFLLLRLGLKK